MKYHNWQISEIDNLIQWEREIYVVQILQWIEEEKERQKQQ
jgi:hypothetical protein